MAADEPKSRGGKGLRTGYTTGACAAAAAKAATRCLVQNATLEAIESTLPNRQRVAFSLARCERQGATAICSVVKDAGDDPDCTHGAELVAEVVLRGEPGVEIRGGAGVARVTKPGLGLVVGTSAINPVPQKNIREMVVAELAVGAAAGALVTIWVPGGEEMATKTTNARLGLLGGISILGTTGIVRPYSTAAFKASVVQEVDVAAAAGLRHLVLTTGGKSEGYAMALYPALSEGAFIQVGDFVGVGLRQCARRGVQRAIIVGMMGKLSKMAKGHMQTHAAGSQVDLAFLASLAAEVGASEALVLAIREANTARHVLQLCREANLLQMPERVCAAVAARCRDHVKGRLEVHVCLVDFAGDLLGWHPPAAFPSAFARRQP